MLCFAIINTHEKSQKSYEAEFARSLLSSGREYYQSLSDFSDKLRILKHDNKYHLTALHKLAASGDLDSVNAYLKTMDLRYEDAQIHTYCTSPVINAFLGSFRERCEAGQVCFSAQVILCPGLDDYELCVILGNLLENAFEAVQKLPVADREITLSMKQNGSQFGIRVENSFDGKIVQEDETFVSAKTSGGMGIRSIRAIVARTGGTYDADWDEHMFRAYAVLNIDNTGN